MPQLDAMPVTNMYMHFGVLVFIQPFLYPIQTVHKSDAFDKNSATSSQDSFGQQYCDVLFGLFLS